MSSPIRRFVGPQMTLLWVDDTDSALKKRRVPRPGNFAQYKHQHQHQHSSIFARALGHRHSFTTTITTATFFPRISESNYRCFTLRHLLLDYRNACPTYYFQRYLPQRPLQTNSPASSFHTDGTGNWNGISTIPTHRPQRFLFPTFARYVLSLHRLILLVLSIPKRTQKIVERPTYKWSEVDIHVSEKGDRTFSFVTEKGVTHSKLEDDVTVVPSPMPFPL